MRCRLATLIVVALILPQPGIVLQVQAQDKPPAFEPLLDQGKLAEAEQLLSKALAEQPGDDNARYALGVTQFLRAVETRIQAFHKYGFRSTAASVLRVTNLPIPPNPTPDPLDYKTARSLLQGWVDDLARVDATLAPIQAPDVKLPLRFGLIRLDFTGKMAPDQRASLWEVYKNFNRNPNVSKAAANNFVIGFDRSDVDWLRGYCHLLTALTEALLAYDFEDLFNRSGYFFFDGVKAPEPFLVVPPIEKQGMVPQIADLAALIHLMHFEVAEPARLRSALAHLETAVALSRSSWKLILAETDDDHEWVPNPNQHTVVPDGQTTPEMVQTWTEFLDEFAAILSGKKLAPFWRGTDPKRGLNVRRIMTEPCPFDLVLWLQGTALVPYLEAGDVTRPEVWTRFDQVFRGNFIGFALWYN